MAETARKARLSVPSSSLPWLVGLFPCDRPAPTACDAGDQVAHSCALSNSSGRRQQTRQRKAGDGGSFLPEPTQRDEASRGLSPDPKDRDHQADGRFGQEAAATNKRQLPGLAAPEGRHSADPQAAFGHHPFQSQSHNYLRITVWLNVRLTVASSAQASPIANARRGFARRTSRRPRRSDCFRLSASAISFSGGFVPHITCDKCMQSRCECGSSFSNQNRDTNAMNEL